MQTLKKNWKNIDVVITEKNYEFVAFAVWDYGMEYERIAKKLGVFV